MADTTTPPKLPNPLAKFNEPKPKQGPHKFDAHIVVPSEDDKHSSGAVPVKGSHGIRQLPNGASGLKQPLT